jgi:hypothetical protein
MRSVLLPHTNLIAAYGIFMASYFVFALGKFPGLKIDRPGAAVIGAVAMVAFRVVQPQQALHFIDFSTLVLLFSMMLIVGNLHLVGFFEWYVEFVLRRLKPSHSARSGMGLVVDFQHLFCGELGAGLGGGRALVAEQLLDAAQIRAFFQQVSSD